MAYTHLLYEKREGVAEITFNRPEKLNAFNRVLWKETATAIKEASEDPEVRVLLLTGKGRAFSAGNDLSDFSGIVEGGAVMENILNCDKPTIAAVNGICYAGAFELAVLCDFLIAARDAPLAAREARIGLLPVFTLVNLTYGIGERKARDIALTGRDISGEEAYRIGLALKSVEPERLMDEARAFARILMEASPLAQKEIKRALRKDRKAETQALLTTFGKLMGTQDFREALAAFAQRRKPVWRGK